jgi:hypothetical protein
MLFISSSVSQGVSAAALANAAGTSKVKTALRGDQAPLLLLLLLLLLVVLLGCWA